MGDPVGQRAGLAGARAGDDQERPAGLGATARRDIERHGRALRRVERAQMGQDRRLQFGSTKETPNEGDTSRSWDETSTRSFSPDHEDAWQTGHAYR